MKQVSDRPRTKSLDRTPSFQSIRHSAIVVLPAPSDRWVDLKPLVPEGLAMLAKG